MNPKLGVISVKVEDSLYEWVLDSKAVSDSEIICVLTILLLIKETLEIPERLIVPLPEIDGV